MRILLVIPPLTQLNTPYPATTVLKGFLEGRAGEVRQYDLGIETVNRVFTRPFLSEVFLRAFQNPELPSGVLEVLAEKERYLDTVEAVMRFLRGGDDTLAVRIASEGFLPRGPRFRAYTEEERDWAFGPTGVTDRARHCATLYLEDLTDLIRSAVSPRFDLVRYGEQLALSAPAFDPLRDALESERPDPVDALMLELLEEQVSAFGPDLAGFTVPFPGCLYAALKCGQFLKKRHQNVATVIGGGYPTTELRQLSDPRVFDYVDYIVLDDGETPCLRIAERLAGKRDDSGLVRTLYRKEGRVVRSGNGEARTPFAENGTPDFSGLEPSRYLSLIELTNPMHRLWSDGRWNKMTVAHGCYWAQCAFCDTSLDYIGRYEAPSATQAADRMESIMRQTGSSGFHFTDEALPPRLLKELSREILRRKRVVSFWGNIRFEKAYTRELCELLARAGCIAVSGGLEVASERILEKIGKGVTIAQAARSMRNLTDAGIMVHAYLMYGFPTQTVQETVDSLEIVRQLFACGLVQSAFWHRYAMTVHSPSGRNPEAYGARRTDTGPCPFANNGVDFTDGQRIDWDRLGKGLRKAVYNYMHGLGLEAPLRKWLGKGFPPPRVAPDRIAKLISAPE